MTYVYSPWRALRPMLRQARQWRTEGHHKWAIELLDIVAANRRRYLATGSFRPQFPRKEDTHG